MQSVKYDANPPVLRNNPAVFVVSVIAVALALVLSGQAPQLILLVLALLILGWLVLFVLSKTHRLTITENEVRYVHGLLAKDRTEMSLSSVRSIRIDQSFLQRILGVAAVEFYSAGDQPEIRVAGMPDPHRIRDIIDG